MENEELERSREEDALRHQMEDTRTSLTEKLEVLEQKLVNTVQETTSAVTDTVTSVKDSVECTVASVKDSVQDTVVSVRESMHDGVESVKEFLDVKTQTSHHPWMMLGGSVFFGYVLGNMLTEKGSSYRRSAASVSMPSVSRSLYSNGGTSSASNGGNREKSSLTASLPSWLGALEPEMNKLKGLAIGAALGTVREMITGSVPPSMGQHLKEIIDDVTKKMGGEPIPSTDWAGCPVSSTTAGEHVRREERDELNLGNRWKS